MVLRFKMSRKMPHKYFSLLNSKKKGGGDFFPLQVRLNAYSCKKIYFMLKQTLKLKVQIAECNIISIPFQKEMSGETKYKLHFTYVILTITLLLLTKSKFS